MSPAVQESTPAPRGAVFIDHEARQRQLFLRALFTNTPHTFVTWIVIAINIAVFLAMAVRTRSIVAFDTTTALVWGASYGPAITTQGEWWRLLTGTFLHSGIIHIAGNMYVLRVMGPLTERLFGNVKYAVLYLVSAFVGSLASVYWHPLVPSVGASGAVFGVMGAVLAYTLRERRSMPSSILRSIGSGAGQSIAINLVLGFAIPHVDVAAHVGGLLGGFTCGWWLAAPLDDGASRTVRRTAATTAAAALFVVLAARQLPAFDDLLATLTRYDRLEHDTWARLQALDKEPMSDQRARDHVATAIAGDVLPPWHAMRNEIARLRLPTDEHTFAAAQVHYMDLQAEAWRLSAESYRTGDLRVAKASRDKSREAMAAKAEIEGRAAAVPAKDDRLDAAIAWQTALQTLADADNKAAAAYNAAVKEQQANRLTSAQFAEIVETQVIPAARAAADAVSAPQTTPELQGQQQHVAAYARLRLESWRLRAQALRADSREQMRDLMRQADQKQTDAEAAANAK